ncbi:MAG: peptidylprolyl isomerase, partial [Pseudomonadota bacterium]
MKIASLLLGLTLLSCSTSAYSTSILIRTTLGDITVDLFEDEAPASVANFMNYVRADDFRQSVVHRSVPGFIIQGGGFTILNDAAGAAVRTQPPVANEFGRSNLRGTFSYALQGSNIDSATSQWFINLGDNSDSLDPQQFTVFGEVTSGMDVVDAIGALERANAGGVFAELPVRDFEPGSSIT